MNIKEIPSNINNRDFPSIINENFNSIGSTLHFIYDENNNEVTKSVKTSGIIKSDTADLQLVFTNDLIANSIKINTESVNKEFIKSLSTDAKDMGILTNTECIIPVKSYYYRIVDTTYNYVFNNAKLGDIIWVYTNLKNTNIPPEKIKSIAIRPDYKNLKISLGSEKGIKYNISNTIYTSEDTAEDYSYIKLICVDSTNQTWKILNYSNDWFKHIIEKTYDESMDVNILREIRDENKPLLDIAWDDSRDYKTWRGVKWEGEKVVGLNLSESGVHIINSINKLKELTELHLDRLMLIDINIHDLNKLKVLTFNENEISATSLYNLPLLSVLECTNNKISELHLNEFTKLTYLDCTFNNINIIELNNNVINNTLSTLLCSQNSLTDLYFINNKNNISEFDCTYNIMNETETNRLINIGFNAGSVIPQKELISDVDILRQIRDENPNSKLKEMWSDSIDPHLWSGIQWINDKVSEISFIESTGIINSLSNITKLKKLIAFNGRGLMTDFIDFSNMDNLERISIYDSALKYIALDNLPNLTSLKLVNNELETIPISNTVLPIYDFTYNYLTPAEIQKFRSLGYLDTYILPQKQADIEILRAIRNNNPNSKLPEYWKDSIDPSRWPGVKWNNKFVIALTLDNTLISNTIYFDKLTNLERLYISGGKFNDISLRNLSKLTLLNINETPLIGINGMETLKSLRAITLYNTSINNISFGDKASLEIIECYNNTELTSISFDNSLPKLYNLKLNNNNLTRLELPLNSPIQSIFANDNKLEYMDFENLPNLVDIDIANNKFEGNINLSNSPNTSLISISNNKFTSLIFNSNAPLQQLLINNNNIKDLFSIQRQGGIGIYDFTLNYINNNELDRLRSLGFRDESKLVPQKVIDDVAVLKDIRNVNNISKLNTLFNDASNPYTEWKDASYNGVIFKMINDVSRCTSLTLNDMPLTNVQNIYKLSELNNLSLVNTDVSVLDISKLNSLTQLRISDDLELLKRGDSRKLQSINITNYKNADLDLSGPNEGLQYITLIDGSIKNLNVLNLQNLKQIYCKNLPITELNIRYLQSIKTLWLENCQNLNNIHFYYNNYLTTLNIENSLISEIDTTSLINLESLTCTNSKMTTINILNLNKFTSLVSEKGILDTFIGDFSKLTTFRCKNNLFKNMSFITSKSDALTNFDIRYNYLPKSETDRIIALGYDSQYVLPQNMTDLDVLKNIRDNNPGPLTIEWADSVPITSWPGITWENNNVTQFNVNKKNLTSLHNINKLTNLTFLQCTGNKISDIDVSGLTKLEVLCLDYNLLTTIDVNSLIKLKSLSISNNLLTSLNVSNLLELNLIDITQNQISTILGLDKCLKLDSLYISNNKFINLSNLFAKNLITNYYFPYNNLSIDELNRLRSIGFNDDSRLLPQKA